MKKILVALTVLSMALSFASAQEMEEPGVINTLWTGFGVPSGNVYGVKHGDFRWAGIIDTVQARVDVGKFTMDGMLSWGFLTDWDYDHSGFDDFNVVNTGLTQFQFLEEQRDRESYYLNFIWHPFEGFDAGMGTELNWGVGPYPYTDGLTFMPLSHVVQGDLRSGAPAAKNVTGNIKYAYKYADKALAARYKYKDIFQIGIAIPDFDVTRKNFREDFTLNIGAEVHPIKLLTIAAAYENLVHKGGNFYTGLKLDISEFFKIDAWFGLDGIAYDKDTDVDAAKKWGTGVAVYIKFGKLPLWVRPEAGFADYLYEHYSAAFYTGARIQWDITEQLHLGAWGSFAWGAEDKRWDDKNSPYYNTKLDHGGHIFNIRPDFTFDINENHSISAVFEFEKIRSPDDSVINGIIFGLFWKYNKAF